jgi:hypothetical protein
MEVLLMVADYPRPIVYEATRIANGGNMTLPEEES